jgi:MFS family permease
LNISIDIDSQNMSQKRNKIFPGWFIIIALFFIWLVTQGMTTHSFTSLIEPITNRFGWNYTEVTLAVSIYNFVYMLLMPFIGLAVDRWSARKLIFAGITLSSIGMFLLSWINTPGHLYLCYVLMGIGGSTCITTVPMTIAGRWFRKKLSLATSIVMSGSGAGGLIVPLVTRVIDTTGWHTAMMVLGAGMFIVVSPLTLFVRQRPEQYGYLPDGDADDSTVSDEGPASVQDTEKDVGVKQALKSRPFWHISLGFLFHIFAPVALQVHIMPYLSTMNMDRTISSFMASTMLVSSIVGRLLSGWFGDRFDKRWTAAAGTSFVGLGLILLSCITPASTGLLVPAIILCGIGWGAPATMHPVLLREYFGTRHLGTMIGFSMFIMVIGIVAGPPFTSMIYEHFGDYRIAWFILMGMVAISVISQLTNPSATDFRQRESRVK